MIGSYGIYSKLAYKLSLTLVGKTQTKHLPDQPDLVICSLFANFFQQKMSSIINILPKINSARLNLKLTSTQNHYSYFSLHAHDIVLSLMISLNTSRSYSTKSTSFIITIFYWIYRLNHSYISYIIYCSTFNEIFVYYSDLKKTNLDQSNLSSYRPISQLSSIYNTSE